MCPAGMGGSRRGSFGYFDRAQNDALLARFARALRPGGRLLIEMHNPGRLFEPQGDRLLALATR